MRVAFLRIVLAVALFAPAAMLAPAAALAQAEPHDREPPPAAPVAAEEPAEPAVDAAVDDEDPVAHTGQPGIQVALLGPAALLTGGVAFQISPRVELNVSLGWNAAATASSQGSATATADATLLTPFARARAALFGSSHAFLIEGGGGATRVKLHATGADQSGNSLTYDRGGTVPMVLSGIGYNLRTEAGFRLAVVTGYMAYISGLDASTVTTTGSFNATDRQEMQVTLDGISDGLAASRLYLEVTFGWMF